MPKKRRPPEREGNQYFYAWAEVVESYDPVSYDLDIEKIKRLIFDTYVYFYKGREYNSVLREDLRIYKYISQYCCFDYYPDSWKASEAETCVDFARGLCMAIEGGFEAYGRPSLSLSYGGLPAGCSPALADMSSYESYEKEFEEEIQYFREMYEEDVEYEHTISWGEMR